MGSDVRLLFFPRRVYRELLGAADRFRWWHALRRPLLISVVLGFALALAATASVSAAVVLPTTLWWSIAPLLQVIAAALLVLSARTRPVPLARGVDLVLAGHAPWSLWLLLVAACFAVGGSGQPFRTIALVSLVAVVLCRFTLLYHCCRASLACSRRAALCRTVLHQGAMWALLLAYAAWAVALPARVS